MTDLFAVLRAHGPAWKHGQPVHPRDEEVEVDVSPHLPVGDDVKASFLLESQRSVDCLIFDVAVLRIGKLSLSHCRARVDKFARPQQRPDDIRVVYEPISGHLNLQTSL